MKLIIYLASILLPFHFHLVYSDFNVIADSKVLLSNGKKEYELLLQKKQTPLYGDCWSDAILRMERSCKLLDEFRQSWLATLFTNCFLKATGFQDGLLGEKCLKLIDLDYENLFEDDLKACTQNIDMKIFHTYSLFYVHTQSICFYLQSEQWQKRTEDVVNGLIESSRLVSKDLIVAVGSIEQLKSIQDNSLSTQRSINEQLRKTKADMEDFNIQSKANRDLLERVIDQFILLRHFILVEFSLNSSIFFYIISMVVVYFITTTKRAQGARFPLYMLLISSFVIEKKCIDFIYHLDRLVSKHVPLMDMDGSDVHLEHLTMSRALWLIRKTMMSIMAFVYAWWVITYRDIMQISFQMINEHTKILKEIQRDIKASPEKYLLLKQAYEELTEESSSESSNSLSDTFSDYSESDVEFSDYDQENSNVQKAVKAKSSYQLRSKISKMIPKVLPKEYERESINDFVKVIKRSTLNPVNINAYSSDEDF